MFLPFSCENRILETKIFIWLKVINESTKIKLTMILLVISFNHTWKKRKYINLYIY